MAVKRIGVLTSGGDAPGMNPCVRAVVRTALYHGIECYGIRRGWNGLISGDIVKLDEKSVSHTINRGGTILYTARSQEFITEEGQRKAVSVCKFLGLDSIIAIGGDGTFRGARALSKYGINVIGIPATIDIGSVVIPQPTPPSSVLTNCETPCNLTNDALSSRSWAVTPVILLCMSALPWALLRFWFPKRKLILSVM